MSLMDSCEMKKYIGVWRSLLVDTRENNLTAVTEFFLLAFQVSQDLQILLYFLLLVVYCGTLCGNLLVITLVSISKNLHTPMYFFISQLSISDILLTTTIVPNMLHIILDNGGAITFINCLTQFYIFGVSEVFECFLLTVMSYDRYVAICNPLRYTSIMTSGHCLRLTVISWFLGSFIILINTITTSELSFCGPNIIDHFFCDLVPLKELACSDIFIIQLEMYLQSIPIVIIPTTIIGMSYTYIILAILRIPSSTGRQKAFSTCSSHLIVVSIFYSTLFSVYIFPTKGQTVAIGKILSLLYTVITPFINPIIYSLRNKDIRKAVQRNLTVVTEFFLIGFQGSHLLRIVLFLLFFIVFDATICGNLLIITLVSISKNLHTPRFRKYIRFSATNIIA
ncbi:olfactory receptor 5G9-like [Rhinoderma darwinii]|uniref:olfactory receptor 5G9-like n=1 Tax=Rhinoderma darwinii TaxID=43563 RepID=UPI003F6806AB